MSEKIRRVIGKAIAGEFADGEKFIKKVYGKYFREMVEDVPVGTPIEIVALVEPEKELVRPEGAVWGPDTLHSDNRYVLMLPGVGVIASAYDGEWHVAAVTSAGNAGMLKENQLAAEHALADAGLYGFGWKVKPPYVAYATRTPNEKWNTWNIIGYSAHALDDAYEDFNHKKNAGWNVTLYGSADDDEMTIIDRHVEGGGE